MSVFRLPNLAGAVLTTPVTRNSFSTALGTLSSGIRSSISLECPGLSTLTQVLAGLPVPPLPVCLGHTSRHARCHSQNTSSNREVAGLTSTTPIFHGASLGTQVSSTKSCRNDGQSFHDTCVARALPVALVRLDAFRLFGALQPGHRQA